MLWPEPGREELPRYTRPDGIRAGLYPLSDDRAYSRSAASSAERRRIFIDPQKTVREKEALIQWAARNRIDAVVFSFRDKNLKQRSGLPGKAERYALIVERGGWDLSLLVPQRYFLLHSDMFRMDEGKRRKESNFCPTNPETIKVLQNEAKKIFLPAGKDWTSVYHLWPDKGCEKIWCSCPACRAFSPEEQNRIAVNAAADILGKTDPAARLSYYEASDPSQKGIPESRLPLRKNLFRLKKLPGD
jgi:hypothetical protein